MKVVLINSSESSGGAAIACNRLHQAHKHNNLDSSLLVQSRSSSELDENVYRVKGRFPLSLHEKSTFYLEKLSFLPYEKDKKARFAFSSSKFGHSIHTHPVIKEADIIHLHWINKGFISIKSLNQLISLNKPIVWTMHDMWPITGGCHYSDECTNYKSTCGNCFMLKNPNNQDLSNRIWRSKQQLFQKKNAITFVTCSKWLQSITQSSSLAANQSVTSIPNCINTERYKQAHRSLDSSKIALLFQAMNIGDQRKGFEYFLQSLKTLKRLNANLCDNIVINVIGKANPSNYIQDLGFTVEYSGLLKNESEVIKAYQKAHLYIIPSLQDNLPNTVMEALSCSLPVIGFNTGGIPEMVVHKHNGYIAPKKDSEDLARGILWALSDPVNYSNLRQNARRTVEENYSYSHISNRYLTLYKELLANQYES